MSTRYYLAVRICIIIFDVCTGFTLLRHVHQSNGGNLPTIFNFATDFSGVSFIIAALLVFSKKPLWALLAEWISFASVIPIILFKFISIFSIPYNDAGIRDPNSEGWAITIIAICLGGIARGIHSFLSSEIARQ